MCFLTVTCLFFSFAPKNHFLSYIYYPKSIVNFMQMTSVVSSRVTRFTEQPQKFERIIDWGSQVKIRWAEYLWELKREKLHEQRKKHRWQSRATIVTPPNPQTALNLKFWENTLKLSGYLVGKGTGKPGQIFLYWFSYIVILDF